MRPTSRSAKAAPAALLRAAIYARRSSDDKAEVELRSVERQIAKGEAHAASRGWTVVARFKDEAISGAIADRPGVLQIRAALTQTPRPFDVLICADASRLGREQLETLKFQKFVSDAGVRIVYYETGREPDLTTAVGKFMASADNFGSEIYRE